MKLTSKFLRKGLGGFKVDTIIIPRLETLKFLLRQVCRNHWSYFLAPETLVESNLQHSTPVTSVWMLEMVVKKEASLRCRLLNQTTICSLHDPPTGLMYWCSVFPVLTVEEQNLIISHSPYLQYNYESMIPDLFPDSLDELQLDRIWNAATQLLPRRLLSGFAHALPEPKDVRCCNVNSNIGIQHRMPPFITLLNLASAASLPPVWARKAFQLVSFGLDQLKSKAFFACPGSK